MEDWISFAASNSPVLEHIAVSSGSGSEDYAKLKQILEAVPNLKYICLDVANGYSEHFVSFVRQARKDFPSHTIMVSQDNACGKTM